jgi:hypothetical protein
MKRREQNTPVGHVAIDYFTRTCCNRNSGISSNPLPRPGSNSSNPHHARETVISPRDADRGKDWFISDQITTKV